MKIVMSVCGSPGHYHIAWNVLQNGRFVYWSILRDEKGNACVYDTEAAAIEEIQKLEAVYNGT